MREDTTSPEERRLRALHELHVLDTEREERFDRVTRLCQRLFGVPMAAVNLIDRDRQWSKSMQGLDLDELPRTESLCAEAIEHENGLVVTDLQLDPDFRGNPLVRDTPRLRFYAGVPLAAPGGERVGTLCIFDTVARPFSFSDRRLLRDLALWVEKELGLDEELERAAEVQRALLPTAPPRDPRWDIAGLCCPSREIGGDFFDWFTTEEGTVVTLGDVMGKGMPAAILMATVRAALRAAGRARRLEDGLHQAAGSLLEDLTATASFATVVQARLGDEGRVDLVDAGHGYAAVVGADGEATALTESQRGLPLGIDSAERYATAPAQLAVGDQLVLHSDGLLELPGWAGSERGRLRAAAGSTTAAEAIDNLIAGRLRHRIDDDVTVVVARRVA